MLMDSRSIGIFDQYIGKACAKGRLRCSFISLVLIYLITMWVCHVAKVRLRCSFISPVLIYLITMWVWHVPKLDLDVYAYYLY